MDVSEFRGLGFRVWGFWFRASGLELRDSGMTHMGGQKVRADSWSAFTILRIRNIKE